MPTLDTAIIADILTSIAPFAIEFAITFALAEFIFQWFMRVAFGKNLN